jgi:hypothetical protein
MKIYINNEEVVCDNILEITEDMLQTSSTILDNCYPKSWEANHDYTSQFYFPPDYSKCKIYKDDELIFCGLVKNTGSIELNPREPHFCSLQILDFKALLSEGDTLDFVITNKTIPQAIEQVVQAVASYGFVLGEIEILNPDDVIGAYSTLNKTAYDVFQYLADISQARWGTRLINENTIAIDFYDPTLMPQGTDLEYTQEFFEDNGIIDMTYSYNTGDYRNKQIMLSEQVYGDIDYSQEIIADGYSKSFVVDNAIAILKTASVNGVSSTIATKEEQEAGIVADFYYTPGSNEITTENSYIAATTIEFGYTPLVKGRQVIYNNTEVQRVGNQINRNGVISRYENRNDILSSEELQKVGESYIKYKGKAEIILNVKTNGVNLYNVGEIVDFTAPITQLNRSYMVKKKITTFIIASNQIIYEYELTSSYNSEQAINYFDNQRAKAEGNIQSGEYITRNIDIENEANIIFDNYTQTEESFADDNVLNCPLNAPLIK